MIEFVDISRNKDGFYALSVLTEDEYKNISTHINNKDLFKIVAYGYVKDIDERKIHKFMQKIKFHEEYLQARLIFLNSICTTEHDQFTNETTRYECHQGICEDHESSLSAFYCALELLRNPELIIIQYIPYHEYCDNNSELHSAI